LYVASSLACVDVAAQVIPVADPIRIGPHTLPTHIAISMFCVLVEVVRVDPSAEEEGVLAGLQERIPRKQLALGDLLADRGHVGCAPARSTGLPAEVDKSRAVLAIPIVIFRLGIRDTLVDPLLGA